MWAHHDALLVLSPGHMLFTGGHIFIDMFIFLAYMVPSTRVHVSSSHHLHFPSSTIFVGDIALSDILYL